MFRGGAVEAVLAKLDPADMAAAEAAEKLKPLLSFDKTVPGTRSARR